MNDKRGSGNSTDAQEIHIARLAFIGASVATLGDAISAVAAGLELEALEKKSSNQNSQNPDEQSKHTSKMQQEIDYIINELKQIKRMLK